MRESAHNRPSMISYITTTKSYGAASLGAAPITGSIGVRLVNAKAFYPASACQSPASAGVKPLTSQFRIWR
jgi:hypothetical protein